MQEQQNHPITSFGNVLLFVVVAVVGASLSAVRRTCKIRVAAYHIVLAAFIGPLLAFLAFIIWPGSPIYLGVVICGAVGLMIFGLAVMLERTSKRIEDVNPISMLPGQSKTPEENKP